MSSPGLTFFPPSSPLPPGEGGLQGETHYIRFIGDEQLFDEPRQRSFYRALSVLGVGPPGLRLPGMTTATPYITQLMARIGIPEEHKHLNQGIISTGDTGDVGSTREIDLFFRIFDKIKAYDPLNQLLMYVLGNHDVIHAGAANSGDNFFGVLGFGLNLWDPRRNYRRDIHATEVGTTEFILDKLILINKVIDYFAGKDVEVNPVILAHSYAPSQYLRSNQNNMMREMPSVYRLKGEKEKNWNDVDEVFSDFWKQKGDNVWEAIVGYKMETPKRRPEQKEFMVRMIKAEEMNTTNGDHPLYFIALDTMDYMDDGTDLGAIQGHVSSEQVQVIKAAILKAKVLVKKDNPHAQAKFVFVGHFDPTRIANFKESGLNEILSDEDVVTYVGAHTHDRGYKDLNSPELAIKYGIQRTTSLPVIIDPSVTDWPNEMLVLKYGVENPSTNEFYLDFTFTGIDRDEIPGLNDQVLAEYKEILPYLNSFGEALKRFDDAKLAEFANPNTPLYRKIYLAAQLDDGLLTKPGALHDLVIAHDVIPTMIQDNVLHKRLFADMIKLEVADSGYQDQANAFEGAYTKRLDHLVGYYEGIRQAKSKGENPSDMEAHDLDKFQKEYEQKVAELKQLAQGLSDEGPAKERLQQMVDIADMLATDLEDFRAWVERYNRKREDQTQSDEELRALADLYGYSHIQGIMEHMKDLPVESPAAAYAILVGLESAVIYRDYRNPITSLAGEEKEVPDNIRITVSTETSRIQVTQKDLPDATWLSIPSYKSIGAEVIPQETVPESGIGRTNQVQGHWEVTTGLSHGNMTTSFEEGTKGPFVTTGPQNGISVEVGRQWHLLNSQYVPRINTCGGLGAGIKWQNYQNIPVDGGRVEQWTLNGELPLYGCVTVGDPFGWIDVGGKMMAGPALRTYDENPLDESMGVLLPTGYWSYGLVAHLAEGSVWAQYMRENYLNSEFYTNGGIWSVGVNAPALKRVLVGEKR